MKTTTHFQIGDIAITGHLIAANMAAIMIAFMMGTFVIILSPNINAQHTADVDASACTQFDHTHGAFTEVLKKHVRKGKVNYKALKNDPKRLNEYLNALESVCKSDFSIFSKHQKLAFYINAYNAYTLHLVVQNYPVKSIRQIGGVNGDPWKQKSVRLKNLFGRNVSLDYLENKVIRPRFKEPRIHFALNCASRGCPPLRVTAFTDKGLRTQLSTVTRNFLGNPHHNRYDAAKNTLQLSKVFEWFAKDFGGPDQLAAFFAQYAPSGPAAAVQKQLTSGTPPKVTFSAYDWDLNQ